MDNTWLDIIRTALNEAIGLSDAAVAGAKLRQAVARVARERGLQFPPQDMGKFSAFVENFPADFIIQRRPGQDILVAPSGRPEMLMFEPELAEPTARVREDLFNALTKINQHETVKAYYLPDSDTVTWLSLSEEPPSTAVELPQTSLIEELQIRRRFISSTVLPQISVNVLTESLATDSPLRSFTEAVRAYGLARQWHKFRLHVLSEQLREWCVAKSIPWRSNWIASPNVLTSASRSVPSPNSDSNGVFVKFASRLTNEDAARINVPLDIVIRILSA
ncbi:MAG: hypothetical protein ACLQVD_20445 [Capsulimonadaceae bacterium]